MGVRDIGLEARPRVLENFAASYPPQYVAPTELAFICERAIYKDVAPTEHNLAVPKSNPRAKALGYSVKPFHGKLCAHLLLAIGYSERFPVHAKQSYLDAFNAGHTRGGRRCDAIFHHRPEGRRKSFYR